MTAEARLLPIDPPPPETVGRYHLVELFDERGRVERWTAEDDGGHPVVVFIERQQNEAAGTILAWEQQIRDGAADRGLAGVIERFNDGGRACLALEYPGSVSLWG